MSKAKALSKMTTVGEVLEAAAEFDREAHSFYTDLIPRISKNIRYLVEDLARDELRHIRMLSKLAKNPEVAAHMQDEIKRPQADRKFTDAAHAPELGDNPDDQEVLLYALAREQIAIEEYSELAENTEPGLLHDTFQFLANEERKHKADLEALYYEIVHTAAAPLRHNRQH
ncbi:ferritin family protein [Aliiroseovarius subalbicans]|uniref:ferritin family protein n=1 Tax=Aliiroseovarius subalbicans TaxID=2925840 RepID=UPI001F574A2C|nr:ferritin family protein [Aliiroseovarius subalbicans]MCI2400861.1 ferritin family protein [Aliiroseovarius subalbicans]